MKWLKLIFWGLCGLQICQLSYAQEALTEKYSQSELLRNWALSHCLSLVYKMMPFRMMPELQLVLILNMVSNL